MIRELLADQSKSHSPDSVLYPCGSDVLNVILIRHATQIEQKAKPLCKIRICWLAPLSDTVYSTMLPDWGAYPLIARFRSVALIVSLHSVSGL